MDQTVELFSGRHQAFSQIASALGFRTFTVDIDASTSPNLEADVRSLREMDLPVAPLVVWAAPPDATVFQNADAWESDGSKYPKNSEAEEALNLFRATISAVSLMKPKWWFIENPKSVLRSMPVVAGFNRGYPSRTRHTIRSDEFGGNGFQEIDIWTNAYWWLPRPGERSSNDDVAPSRRVPASLFAGMFEQLAAYQETQHS